MSAECEQNAKGRKALKVLKIAVIVFVIIVAAEYIMSKACVDNFYTLAAIPVGNFHDTYDFLPSGNNYTIARNYRGKPVFRHPTAAFNETKKRCAPVINDLRKKNNLPPFSPRTYHEYMWILGSPPAYRDIPGCKPHEADGMADEMHYVMGIYDYSTQLIFAPEKNPWAS